MNRILIVLLAAFPISTFAQHQELPNHEFDHWNSFSIPEDWATFETAFGLGNGIVERDSTYQQNGPYSLKAITPDQSGFIPYSLVTLNNMYYDFQNHFIVTQGIGYQSRPDSVWVLYKYEVPFNGPDTAGFALTLQKLNTDNNTPIEVLDVVFPLYQNSQWTLDSYPLGNYYSSIENPDSLYFSLISSLTQPRTENATLFVDGIYFNNPAIPLNIENFFEENRSTINLYPNPSSKKKIFIRDLDQVCSNCKITFYNTKGELITSEYISISNSESAMCLSHLKSGSFFYHIIDENGRIVKKGILILT